MKRMLVSAVILVVGYGLLCLLLYLQQDKLIFFPEVLAQHHRFAFPFDYREHFIDTPDGARLNAIWVQAEEPKGLVLYFHGNAGSLQSWAYVGPDFTALGYDCLIVDYRGYGKSVGPRSEATLLADALTVYDWLTEQYHGDTIVAYGRSLGTGIAAYLAANRPVRRLVLETPYLSMLSMARRSMPIIPVSLLLKYPMRSDRYLPDVNAPVHLIHGTNDGIIPLDEARALAEVPGVQADLSVIEGGGHNNLSAFPEYHATLERLLR